jgi:hypothetical protein
VGDKLPSCNERPGHSDAGATTAGVAPAVGRPPVEGKPDGRPVDDSPPRVVHIVALQNKLQLDHGPAAGTGAGSRRRERQESVARRDGDGRVQLSSPGAAGGPEETGGGRWKGPATASATAAAAAAAATATFPGPVATADTQRAAAGKIQPRYRGTRWRRIKPAAPCSGREGGIAGAAVRARCMGAATVGAAERPCSRRLVEAGAVECSQHRRRPVAGVPRRVMVRTGSAAASASAAAADSRNADTARRVLKAPAAVNTRRTCGTATGAEVARAITTVTMRLSGSSVGPAARRGADAAAARAGLDAASPARPRRARPSAVRPRRIDNGARGGVNDGRGS